KEFGVALGKELLKAAPNGGTYAVISGGAASPNLALRVDGVREALAGSAWTEVPGSPSFSNDDVSLAVQQAGDFVTANPDLKAIVPVGGWPMFAPDGWKNFVEPNKAKVDSGELALVVADTLPMQLELLRDGYAHALVGQRPYEMGEVAMRTLLALKNGEKVEPIIYTGLDLVTKANVGEFLK
ncbi:MAG: sugar ABC transporter substrate-binding protein, partial [Alphaproteobacteria bacterium]